MDFMTRDLVVQKRASLLRVIAPWKMRTLRWTVLKEWVTKLKEPSAVCAKCHIPRDIAEVGAKCHRRVARGERCGGLIHTALRIGDWIKCPSCLASRREKRRPCRQCRGEGWIYVRDLQWFKD